MTGRRCIAAIAISLFSNCLLSAGPVLAREAVAQVPSVAGFQDYKPARAAVPRLGPTYRIGKCLNMSDMLDAPVEGAWGPPMRDSDFSEIADAGFSTVRIPIAFSDHADLSPPYTIDSKFMDRVSRVVALAVDTGLGVIVDMHGYNSLMRDPRVETPRAVALWEQIADRLSSAPRSVWFEIINEPHGKLAGDELNAFNLSALKAIRRSNRDRIVVASGEWNSIYNLKDIEYFDDLNVIPSFHYYDPMSFTHQGATWVKPFMPLGRMFEPHRDRAQLDGSVGVVLRYMKSSGRVPFLGEYGVRYDAAIPVGQRASYYGAVSNAFASIGVDSCAWGYRSTFRLRDGDRWLSEIVDVIGGTRAAR